MTLVSKDYIRRRLYQALDGDDLAYDISRLFDEMATENPQREGRQMIFTMQPHQSGKATVMGKSDQGDILLECTDAQTMRILHTGLPDDQVKDAALAAARWRRRYNEEEMNNDPGQEDPIK